MEKELREALTQLIHAAHRAGRPDLASEVEQLWWGLVAVREEMAADRKPVDNSLAVRARTASLVVLSFPMPQHPSSSTGSLAPHRAPHHPNPAVIATVAGSSRQRGNRPGEGHHRSNAPVHYADLRTCFHL
jgi:hypothetical protein